VNFSAVFSSAGRSMSSRTEASKSHSYRSFSFHAFTPGGAALFRARVQAMDKIARSRSPPALVSVVIWLWRQFLVLGKALLAVVRRKRKVQLEPCRKMNSAAQPTCMGSSSRPGIRPGHRPQASLQVALLGTSIFSTKSESEGSPALRTGWPSNYQILCPNLPASPSNFFQVPTRKTDNAVQLSRQDHEEREGGSTCRIFSAALLNEGCLHPERGERVHCRVRPVHFRSTPDLSTKVPLLTARTRQRRLFPRSDGSPAQHLEGQKRTRRMDPDAAPRRDP